MAVVHGKSSNLTVQRTANRQTQYCSSRAALLGLYCFVRSSCTPRISTLQYIALLTGCHKQTVASCQSE